MLLRTAILFSFLLTGYIICGVLAMPSVLYHTIDCRKLTVGDIIRLFVFLPLAVCAYAVLGIFNLMDKLTGLLEKLDNKRIL